MKQKKTPPLRKKAPTKAEATAEEPVRGAPEVPDELLEELGLPAHHATHHATSPDKKSEDPQGEDPLIENPKTDAAVDDITRKEGDEILAAEDEARAALATPQHRGLGAKIRHGLARWWGNAWARRITLGIILVGLAVVMTVPATRYSLLNAVGVRSGLSVTVLDASTQLPLKNIEVRVGASVTQTNTKGFARLHDVKLGRQTLQLKRIAFAPLRRSIIVGWGSNPLGAFNLTPTGRQYVISATDLLSQKSIAGVQAASGTATAVSDKKGKITLTAPEPDIDTLPVTITADNYRSENLVLHADNPNVVSVKLVPAQKAVFLTKQSGNNDVYSSDIDGQNRQLVLAGTGNETNNLSLVVSPDGNEAALVSTRDNLKDSDGYRLSGITLLNISDNSQIMLDHAEQIQLIDFIGSRLIYQVGVAGASAANPQRYRLISYDYKTSSRVQLAAANQFNAVVSAAGQVYYATSSTDPGIKPAFFRVNPDGSGRQTILDKEVWTALRVGYNTFNLQTPNGWFGLTVGNTSASPITSPGATIDSRLYQNSPYNNHSAWVDQRDGKGVVLLVSDHGAKEAILTAQDGLVYPIRWLNDHVLIYRVSNVLETADYAVSIDGGQAKKITDVTTSYGFSQGY